MLVALYTRIHLVYPSSKPFFSHYPSHWLSQPERARNVLKAAPACPSQPIGPKVFKVRCLVPRWGHLTWFFYKKNLKLYCVKNMSQFMSRPRFPLLYSNHLVGSGGGVPLPPSHHPERRRACSGSSVRLSNDVPGEAKGGGDLERRKGMEP